MVSGDFLIFSSNMSFLFRNKMMDVSVNHLLLQMLSKSFRDSCMRFCNRAERRVRGGGTQGSDPPRMPRTQQNKQGRSLKVAEHTTRDGDRRTHKDRQDVVPASSHTQAGWGEQGQVGHWVAALFQPLPKTAAPGTGR